MGSLVYHMISEITMTILLRIVCYNDMIFLHMLASVRQAFYLTFSCRINKRQLLHCYYLLKIPFFPR